MHWKKRFPIAFSQPKSPTFGRVQLVARRATVIILFSVSLSCEKKTLHHLVDRASLSRRSSAEIRRSRLVADTFPSRLESTKRRTGRGKRTKQNNNKTKNTAVAFRKWLYVLVTHSGLGPSLSVSFDGLYRVKLIT